MKSTFQIIHYIFIHTKRAEKDSLQSENQEERQQKSS